MDRPRRTIHIDREIESLWQKDDQSHMVCYELLKPGETINTKRYQQQLTDLNRTLFEKEVRIPKKVTQGHFL